MDSDNVAQNTFALRCVRALTVLAIYLSLSTFVFTLFCTYPGMNKDSRILFSKVLEGDSYRPFAYRMLMPLLIETAHKGIPDTFWDLFYHYRWKSGIDQELFRANIDRDYVDQWYIFRWISILCFAGFALVLSYLLQLTESVSPTEANSFSWAGLALVPLFFGPVNTWYDPLALVLFPVAFLCLLKEKNYLYFLVFLLACLNKETSILLCAIFWILYRGKNKKFLLACQLAIYSVLFVGIRYYYHDNLGEFVEFHLWNTSRFLTTPSIRLLIFVLKVSMLSYLSLSDWKGKNRKVRQCFIYTVLPLTALFLIWGRLPEIRVFYEVLFLMYILAYVSLKRILVSEPWLKT